MVAKRLLPIDDERANGGINSQMTQSATSKHAEIIASRHWVTKNARKRRTTLNTDTTVFSKGIPSLLTQKRKNASKKVLPHAAILLQHRRSENHENAHIHKP